MPNDNSQKNSGIVATAWAVPPRSMTSNMTAIPEAATSGPPMSPSKANASWHQAGPVHQRPQDHSVRDAGEDARPDQERPVIDRDERVAEGGVRTGRAFLPHEQEGQHAHDPDGDEHGFDEARCDITQSQALAVPLEDRVRHHGGADVRNDEDDLQK